MFQHIQRAGAVAARLIGALILTVAASGCGQVDLQSAFKMEELTSGYYDAGLNDAGQTKMVPSLTFRLKNVLTEPISSVDLLVFYWGEEFGERKEMDEAIVRVVGSDGLQPGALSEPITLRSKQGFTLNQPRAEMFQNSYFRDMTAKLFLKRGGRIVPLGEFTIERRLLLAAPTGAGVQ